MDWQTLRDWVIRFNEQGPEGLIDMDLPGAPPKLVEGSCGIGSPSRPVEVTVGDVGTTADDGMTALSAGLFRPVRIRSDAGSHSRLLEDGQTKGFVAMCMLLTLVFGVGLRAWQMQDFVARDLQGAVIEGTRALPGLGSEADDHKSFERDNSSSQTDSARATFAHIQSTSASIRHKTLFADDASIF